MPLSPLDGKYSARLVELEKVFSNEALVRARVEVEVAYLLALVEELQLEIADKAKKQLRLVAEHMGEMDFESINTHEQKTKHDVKAVEYYVRDVLMELDATRLMPYVHFGLTSEDVNNLAYGMMLASGRHVLLSEAIQMLGELLGLIDKAEGMVMLGRTHGQAAVPTQMDKELLVHARQLMDVVERIADQTIEGKLTGAVGTLAAHQLTHPEHDWIAFSKNFVSSLGLIPTTLTTQVVPPQSNVQMMSLFVELSRYIEGFCQDMWWYISTGYFAQHVEASAVGSSTMPQKVNPIQFENAEGNALMARSVAAGISEKLSYSRLQRDLSDSTVKRNMGVVFGHLVLALQSLSKGIEAVTPNAEVMRADLDDEYGVLMEAVQTMLRSVGKTDAYESVKVLSRGKPMNKKLYEEMVANLDIDTAAKKRLVELVPSAYTGLVGKIVATELNKLADDLEQLKTETIS